MAQQTYFLDTDATEPLTLSWGFNWKNMIISYQGQPVGEIATKEALVAGHEFELPDRRKISVQLKGSFMPQLEILVNNEPVKDSATEPGAVIRQIWKLSFLLGGVNLVFGLVALFWPADFLLRLGMGTGSVITGVVVIALAFSIRKNSMPALLTSIGFWVLDYAFSLYLVSQDPAAPNPMSGLVMRMVIVYTLYRGIAALKQINQKRLAAIMPAKL